MFLDHPFCNLLLGSLNRFQYIIILPLFWMECLPLSLTTSLITNFSFFGQSNGPPICFLLNSSVSIPGCLPTSFKTVLTSSPMLDPLKEVSYQRKLWPLTFWAPGGRDPTAHKHYAMRPSWTKFPECLRLTQLDKSNWTLTDESKDFPVWHPCLYSQAVAYRLNQYPVTCLICLYLYL